MHFKNAYVREKLGIRFYAIGDITHIVLNYMLLFRILTLKAPITT